MTLLPLMLDWPVPALWPNAREHFRTVADARSAQRSAAMWAAMSGNWQRKTLPEGVVLLDLHFCPPTRRSFDLDNALAAMKAALDGLSAVLRVDDRWFSPRLHRGDVRKGGGVVVVAEATGTPWKAIGDVSATQVKETARKRVKTQAGLTETQTITKG